MTKYANFRKLMAMFIFREDFKDIKFWKMTAICIFNNLEGEGEILSGLNMINLKCPESRILSQQIGNLPTWEHS